MTDEIPSTGTEQSVSESVKAVELFVQETQGRRIRITWAVAMGALAGECAWIGWLHLSAEYADRSAWWWVIGAVVVAVGLTLLGWRLEELMGRCVKWALRTAGWLGIPACLIFAVATMTDDDPRKYLPRVQLRFLSAAIDQFRVLNPHRIFFTHDEIIGPEGVIRAMPSPFGEDYRELFPMWDKARVGMMACRDGRKLVFLWDDNSRPLVLDKLGKPIARYNEPEILRRWQEQLRTPNGLRVERATDGTRVEIAHHDGIPDGPFKAYAADGRLIAEATYVKGRLVGPCWRYFRDGSRFDESTMEPSQVAEQKLRANEFAAAIVEFNRAIDLVPAGEYFRGRGDAQRALSNLDAAIADYTLARDAKVILESEREFKNSVAERLTAATADRNRPPPSRK